MSAPFVAYNQDGTVLKSYDNPYYAIAAAADAGLSTNKTYVLDGTGTRIFERSKKSSIFCYDGPNYVGVKDYDEAMSWGGTKSRCWLVNGTGTAYSYLGRDDMAGTEDTGTATLELASGAYNYLFSKQGVLGGANGYAYGKATIRLSEASFLPSQDGNGWNAYAFINVAGSGASMDMGLIGNLDVDGTIHWRPCKNYCPYAGTRPSDAFMTYPTDVMTTSTFNSLTKDYRNADDIALEAWAFPDGFEFKMTNLATKKTFDHKETYANVNGGGDNYYRVLLAASYCPVVAPIWNGSCGAYMKDVVFDGAQVGRYVAGSDYSSAVLDDFYPGEASVAYGYSQGAYWASHDSGVRKESGAYVSGNSYAQGDKYVSFSVAYDGSAHRE